MRVLVVGRGWVGMKMFHELLEQGHVASLVRHEYAISAVDRSYGAFDWVVNCAGVTGTPNVDGCEKEKAATHLANAVFPVELQRACDLADVKLAHFSSGCIYEGEITDVNADPNYFGSTYSVSKGVSDVILKERALVLRVRLPFSGEKVAKNLFTKLEKYSIHGKLMEGGPNSITDIDEAVKITCDLMEENATGPYNLVNPGAVTTHEIADILGLNPQWYTAEEFKAVTAAARSNCVIPSCDRMRPVRDALVDAAAKFRS